MSRNLEDGRGMARYSALLTFEIRPTQIEAVILDGGERCQSPCAANNTINTASDGVHGRAVDDTIGLRR